MLEGLGRPSPVSWHGQEESPCIHPWQTRRVILLIEFPKREQNCTVRQGGGVGRADPLEYA